MGNHLKLPKPYIGYRQINRLIAPAILSISLAVYNNNYYEKFMTGLEAIQLMIEGKTPPPSISVTMNMEVASASIEAVKFTAVATDEHLNPSGNVHGGFSATVLDSVTGCIVMANLEDVEIPYATLDLSVKMLRPVPINEPVYAIGKIINLSKRTAVSEGHLYTQNDNKLLAHATAVCIISRP